eukprot:COSAG06_NODE_49466_length_325_cov_0.796460_1_plen_56_part_01
MLYDWRGHNHIMIVLYSISQHTIIACIYYNRATREALRTCYHELPAERDLFLKHAV